MPSRLPAPAPVKGEEEERERVELSELRQINERAGKPRVPSRAGLFHRLHVEPARGVKLTLPGHASS